MKTALEMVRSRCNELLKSMAAAAPPGFDARRAVAQALYDLTEHPAILTCTPDSIARVIQRACQFGLTIGGPLGHAYVVPYKTTATFQLGYRGMIALAVRSGCIRDMQPEIVHMEDEWTYEVTETGTHFRHVPSELPDPGAIRLAYSVITFPDGSRKVSIMLARDLDKRREASKTKRDDNVWAQWPEEMAKKTIVRHDFKYLAPTSGALQEAMVRDEAEDGEALDASWDEPTTEAPKAKTKGERVAERLAVSEGASPAPTAPPPSEAPAPQTDAQQKAIFASLSALELDDSDGVQARRVFAGILGRPVKSRRDLTKADASRILDKLLEAEREPARKAELTAMAIGEPPPEAFDAPPDELR